VALRRHRERQVPEKLRTPGESYSGGTTCITTTELLQAQE